MEFEILLSLMNLKDNSFLEEMNIDSDIIVVNQTDRIGYEEFKHKDNKVRIYSFPERGVGLSRNSAMMRSNAKYVLFADDDVRYVDNYKKIILEEFQKNPKADIILFNVPSLNKERQTYVIKKNGRVKRHNCLRYGTYMIVAKNESIRKNNICFSLLFGGGAKYSAGEDSFFLYDSLKKGLKIYCNTQIIGYAKQAESTWFKGYTEKYFIDKGVFFKAMFKHLSSLMCFQFLIRHPETYRELGLKKARDLMKKGENLYEKI